MYPAEHGHMRRASQRTAGPVTATWALPVSTNSAEALFGGCYKLMLDAIHYI
jgi:hypothetical protein